MKAVTVYRHSTVKLSYFCSRLTDLIALPLTTFLLSLNINYMHMVKIRMFHLGTCCPCSHKPAGKVHEDTCTNRQIKPAPSEIKQKQNKEKSHYQLRKVCYKLLLTYVILIQECSVNGFIIRHLAEYLCFMPTSIQTA